MAADDHLTSRRYTHDDELAFDFDDEGGDELTFGQNTPSADDMRMTDAAARRRRRAARQQTTYPQPPTSAFHDEEDSPQFFVPGQPYELPTEQATPPASAVSSAEPDPFAAALENEPFSQAGPVRQKPTRKRKAPAFTWRMKLGAAAVVLFVVMGVISYSRGGADSSPTSADPAEEPNVPAQHQPEPAQQPADTITVGPGSQGTEQVPDTDIPTTAGLSQVQLCVTDADGQRCGVSVAKDVQRLAVKGVVRGSRAKVRAVLRFDSDVIGQNSANTAGKFSLSLPASAVRYPARYTVEIVGANRSVTRTLDIQEAAPQRTTVRAAKTPRTQPRERPADRTPSTPRRTRPPRVASRQPSRSPERAAAAPKPRRAAPQRRPNPSPEPREPAEPVQPGGEFNR
jgi:hypothetical protein